MSKHFDIPSAPVSGMLADLIDRIRASYAAAPHLREEDIYFLPDKALVIETLQDLRALMFPGYYCRQDLNGETTAYYLGDLIVRIRTSLCHEISLALCHSRRQVGIESCEDCPGSHPEATSLVDRFLARLPDVRTLIETDVEAAFEGDPAAKSYSEVIIAYPGVQALMVHRLAHELYCLDVPLIPRIMSEHAHSETGIDIHPGAAIGSSFFIDHGTGVVIGETCVIGKHVKIYQGVTLGALSTRGGQRLKGEKRHPTLEDGVTVYGGATILGGETVIGRGVTVGGNVFLTHSVDPSLKVVLKTPELEYRSAEQWVNEPSQ